MHTHHRFKITLPNTEQAPEKYLWTTKSNFSQAQLSTWGARWRSWWRHYATNRQVAGSIPDGVTGIFQWHNPSGRAVALG